MKYDFSICACACVMCACVSGPQQDHTAHHHPANIVATLWGSAVHNLRCHNQDPLWTHKFDPQKCDECFQRSTLIGGDNSAGDWGGPIVAANLQDAEHWPASYTGDLRLIVDSQFLSLQEKQPNIAPDSALSLALPRTEKQTHHMKENAGSWLQTKVEPIIHCLDFGWQIGCSLRHRLNLPRGCKRC